ncbi:MAG: SpoIID/LytB domain-containing protein, partial [Candidatus Neomarinimicrobiota bacterium]
MLIKGSIPTKEPLVSIGLILPGDKQKYVKISSKNNLDYEIKALENQLLVNGEKSSKFNLQELTGESSYNIKPVTAGRGFHWQKQIAISIKGSIKIKNIDGCLYLVNEVGMEDYLMSVATSEMSGECPEALLEAQTIAARSWLMASEEQKHKDLGIDACNDDCCQRYQGIKNISAKAKSAALNTRGKFVIHNNEICDTRYSKSCGGISENNENVWGDSPKEYLRAIFDSRCGNIPDFSDEEQLNKWIFEPPDCYCNNEYISKSELKRFLGSVDEDGDYFRWEITYSNEQLTKIINEKLNESFDSIESLIPMKRGLSGRIISLTIHGEKDQKEHKILVDSEYDIRNTLHPKFLYSSAFVINANSDSQSCAKKITLSGAGWGHGAGLCQIGALRMAIIGNSSEKILKHYFSSTEIKKMY